MLTSVLCCSSRLPPLPRHHFSCSKSSPLWLILSNSPSNCCHIYSFSSSSPPPSPPSASSLQDIEPQTRIAPSPIDISVACVVEDSRWQAIVCRVVSWWKLYAYSFSVGISSLGLFDAEPLFP